MKWTLFFALLCGASVANADILVAEFSGGPQSGRVTQYANDKTFIRKLADVPSAHDVALDNKGHVLMGNHFGGVLFRLSALHRPAMNLLGSGLGRAQAGVAVDANGNIYTSDFGRNQLLKWSSDGGFLGVFATGIPMPDHVVIHDNKLFVAAYGNSAVYAYRLFDGGLDRAFEVQVSGTVGLDFDADGFLYVSGFNNGRVRRISPDFLQSSDVAMGLNQPHGLKVGPDGFVYVCEQGAGRIVRLAPDGSSMDTYIGNLSDPTDLFFGTPNIINVAK